MGQHQSNILCPVNAPSLPWQYPEPDYYIEDIISRQRPVSPYKSEQFNHKKASFHLELCGRGKCSVNEVEAFARGQPVPSYEINRNLGNSKLSTSEAWAEKQRSSEKLDFNFRKFFDDEIQMLTNLANENLLKRSNSEVDKKDNIDFVNLLITEAQKEITFRKSANGSKATLISGKSSAHSRSSQQPSKGSERDSQESVETLTNLLQRLEKLKELSQHRNAVTCSSANTTEVGVQKGNSTASLIIEKVKADIVSLDSGVDGCNNSEPGTPELKRDENTKPHTRILSDVALNDIGSFRFDSGVVVNQEK